jgi:hypothetical protein
MIEPQTTTAESPPSPEAELLSEIETHILNAVNELLQRAYTGEGSAPSVKDRKPDAPPSGTLQDCEFGLLVLKSLEWLSERNRLEGALGEPGKIQKLVLGLVQETVKKITSISLTFVGDDPKGSAAFFSGEPYTLQRSEFGDTFLANLDAAMLIIAFLSAALEKYDKQLSDITFAPSERLKKHGIRSLRDAALLVCNEGFIYATKCKVSEKGQFLGYTCDPKSNQSRGNGGDPGSLSEYDRLFFTWTTCETLYELADWGAYLDSVEKQETAPSFVQNTKALLAELLQDLKSASTWCSQHILKLLRENLRSENIPQVISIVGEFQDLGQDEPPSPELEEKYRQLVAYVAHSYHLSQYAAIRSIEPTGISVTEVDEILSRLDTLVTQHVLASGLDVARHKYLFKALTRRYSLGSPNRDYKDDAYFPLVVRSLSGLLTRTITDLTKSPDVSPEQIKKLVLGFNRSLRGLYTALVGRRPKRIDDGDDCLWSFVADQPYVLYATQRTVFALMEYARFLEVAANWRSSSDEELEKQLREMLAKNLVEALLGNVARKVVESFSDRLRTQSQPLDGDGHAPQVALVFPKAEWTHDVMQEWLASFSSAFEEQQIENLLEHYFKKLKWLRDQHLDPGKSQGNRRHTTMLRELLELVKKTPDLDNLYDKSPWEPSTIIPILFKYTFQEIFSLEGLRQKIEKTTLVETINSAEGKLKGAQGAQKE